MPTVRYACHSVWNQGTSSECSGRAVVYLKNLENLLWLVNKVFFMQICQAEIEEQGLFLPTEAFSELHS